MEELARLAANGQESRRYGFADGGIQPCTTRDFMNYLIWIEYAAENLQFFLWHRDYVKRFSELPPNERALAPEWTVEQAEAEALTNQTTPAAVFKRTDISPLTASMVELKNNMFDTPPRTPSGEGRDSTAPSDDGWGEYDSMKTPAKSYQKMAAGAFAEADIKWQPCKLGSMGVADAVGR